MGKFLNKSIEYFCWIIFFVLIYCTCFGQEKFPVLKGPYLGQTSPGMTPEIFAPGIVSIDGNEILAVFTPDGKEFFYSSKDSANPLAIMYMKQINGDWTKPQVASFSGKYYDCATGVSSDGKKLFFVSLRPIREGGNPVEFQNIWFINKIGDNWQNPEMMPPPVNSDNRDLGASVAKNGNIYFTTRRAGIKGGGCRSKYINGKYTKPESLQELLKTEMPVFEIAVDADEKFMVFASMGTDDGFGGFDLYASFNNGGDNWTKPCNLGDKINTSANEHFATLSHDGKYMFFVSDRISEGKEKKINSPQNGSSDIYWVDAKIIEDLKPKKQKIMETLK